MRKDHDSSRRSYVNVLTIPVSSSPRPLNANISLISTSSVTAKTKSAPAPPIYYIDANTFNSPLSLSIVQDPIPSVVSPLFVSAGNNLGTVDVTLDENFQGTFLAHTEYAEANVQDAGDDSSSPVAVISPSFIVDYAGRTLYYDDIDVPSVSGWVGTGTRPSTSGTGVGAPGCVEVVSVLSPVTLQLGRS